jgi:energy-converting hydrogenase Eha subunit A
MLEGSKERINYLPIIAIIISLILGIIIGYSIKPPSIIRETETKIIKETLPKTEYVLTTITIPTIIPKTIEIEKTIYTATITRVGLTGNLLTTFKDKLYGRWEYCYSTKSPPPFQASTEKGKATIILSYKTPFTVQKRIIRIKELCFDLFYYPSEKFCETVYMVKLADVHWDVLENPQITFEEYFWLPKGFSLVLKDLLLTLGPDGYDPEREEINFILTIEEVYP